MSDDTLSPPIVDGPAHPSHGPQADLISQIAQSPEQERYMRIAQGRITPGAWTLLWIARSQNAERLATIGNQSSLEARRCRQFIFSANALLGTYALPESEAPQPPEAH